MHSGDYQAPSYSVVVSDGSQATAPSLATIHFTGAPAVTTTPVTVTQGGSTTVTNSNLNITNTGGSASNQVIITVSNVQHGQFVLNGSSTSVTNFTLSQLLNHDVQLVQDNSNKDRQLQRLYSNKCGTCEYLTSELSNRTNR